MTAPGPAAPLTPASAAIQANAPSVSEAARTEELSGILDDLCITIRANHPVSGAFQTLAIQGALSRLESVIARAVAFETERLIAAARRLRDCEVPGSDDWECFNSCLIAIMQEAGRMDADGRAVQGETARLREALEEIANFVPVMSQPSWASIRARRALATSGTPTEADDGN